MDPEGNQYGTFRRKFRSMFGKSNNTSQTTPVNSTTNLNNNKKSNFESNRLNVSLSNSLGFQSSLEESRARSASTPALNGSLTQQTRENRNNLLTQASSINPYSYLFLNEVVDNDICPEGCECNQVCPCCLEAEEEAVLAAVAASLNNRLPNNNRNANGNVVIPSGSNGSDSTPSTLNSSPPTPSSTRDTVETEAVETSLARMLIQEEIPRPDPQEDRKKCECSQVCPCCLNVSTEEEAVVTVVSNQMPTSNGLYVIPSCITVDTKNGMKNGSTNSSFNNSLLTPSSTLPKCSPRRMTIESYSRTRQNESDDQRRQKEKLVVSQEDIMRRKKEEDERKRRSLKKSLEKRSSSRPCSCHRCEEKKKASLKRELKLQQCSPATSSSCHCDTTAMLKMQDELAVLRKQVADLKYKLYKISHKRY